MKIAFTGTSGAGKTTLVKFVAEHFGLRHISGSAGDMFTVEDKIQLSTAFTLIDQNPDGHISVIKNSAYNLGYGLAFQMCLRTRRGQAIQNNDDFVMDRSPVDNLTYFINQVGFHKDVTDSMVESFAESCLSAWNKLTHVIYIKPCQPKGVEDNGSRVANKWYQQSIDAQFQYWLDWFYRNQKNGPKILTIDYWDLNDRKAEIKWFLGDRR